LNTFLFLVEKGQFDRVFDKTILRKISSVDKKKLQKYAKQTKLNLYN
jgi:hypothetical protein